MFEKIVFKQKEICALNSVIVDFTITVISIGNPLVMMLFLLGVGEGVSVDVVEGSGEDATEGSASHVHRQVVEEDILGVHWIVPVHENGLAYCQGRVEARGSEPVNIAEGPEVEADGGYTPHAEIRSHSFLACDVKDEKHKDKCADHFHREGGPVLLKVGGGKGL